MIGEQIKKFRTKKGITQEELAEVLYVSRTAVSKRHKTAKRRTRPTIAEITLVFNLYLPLLPDNQTNQTPPKRRFLLEYSSKAFSRCSFVKSGQRTSINTNSEYALSHSRKLESLSSPLGRIIRSHSGVFE